MTGDGTAAEQDTVWKVLRRFSVFRCINFIRINDIFVR